MYVCMCICNMCMCFCVHVDDAHGNIPLPRSLGEGFEDEPALAHRAWAAVPIEIVCTRDALQNNPKCDMSIHINVIDITTNIVHHRPVPHVAEGGEIEMHLQT